MCIATTFNSQHVQFTINKTVLIATKPVLKAKPIKHNPALSSINNNRCKRAIKYENLAHLNESYNIRVHQNKLKANGNGRCIIRHDNSIIFIRNTSRGFAHKSVMAVASTSNSMEMEIPRNQSLVSHPIRKLGNGTLNFNLENLTVEFIVLLKLSCLLCAVCAVIYVVIINIVIRVS